MGKFAWAARAKTFLLWQNKRQRRRAEYDPVAQLGTDLLGYWDAKRQDLMTIGAGNAVSSNRDIKAAIDLVQGTGSAQPVYSATGLHSSQAVVYDGSDDFLAIASVAFPQGATGCEIWTLASQDALPANTTVRSAFSYGGNAGLARTVSRAVVTGVNRARLTTGDGTTGQTLTGTNVNLSGVCVIRAVFSPTTTSLFVNGIAEGTLSVIPNTSNSRTRMGANSNTTAAGFWLGPIGAVLVTNLLSAGKASPLQAWLMSRGGLS